MRKPNRIKLETGYWHKANESVWQGQLVDGSITYIKCITHSKIPISAIQTTIFENQVTLDSSFWYIIVEKLRDGAVRLVVVFCTTVGFMVFYAFYQNLGRYMVQVIGNLIATNETINYILTKFCEVCHQDNPKQLAEQALEASKSQAISNNRRKMFWKIVNVVAVVASFRYKIAFEAYIIARGLFGPS